MNIDCNGTKSGLIGFRFIVSMKQKRYNILAVAMQIVLTITRSSLCSMSILANRTHLIAETLRWEADLTQILIGK